MKYLYLALACVLVACTSRQEQPYTEPVSVAVEEPQTTTSQTTSTTSSPTSSKTVSKGVIGSVTDVTVYGELSEQVMQQLVKEGDDVKQGQTLLVLNDENLRTQVIQAENQMEQAEFRYQEILVGQGYKLDALDKVPENIRNLALMKSGYNAQKESLEQAHRQYEKRVIKAPVSGTVIQFEVHQYDRLQGGAAVCHIIDKEHLKVKFSILETELSRLTLGTEVKVTAIAYPEVSHKATVTKISPVVEENGMVKMEARLEDADKLMPGMTALVERE